MSPRSTLLAAAASAGVLFLGWQAGAGALSTNSSGATSSASAGPVPSTSGSSSNASTPSSSSPSSTTSNGGATPSASVSSGSTSSGSTSSGTTTTAAATYRDGTYSGTTQSHRFGSITVKVTVSGGKITDVTANASANDGHSAQINSRSIPTLRSRVLSAQSADVSTVGGATYTSNGYLDSLQSALDKAKA